MNRRDFNSGFAALLGASTIPVPAAANAVARSSAAPWGAYLFADLIARSRGSVDAGFLTRTLRVSPEIAEGLMTDLTRNGVIGAARVAGVAKAANPIRVPGPAANLDEHVTRKIKRLARDVFEHPEDSVDAGTQADMDAIECRDDGAGAPPSP